MDAMTLVNLPGSIDAATDGVVSKPPQLSQEVNRADKLSSPQPARRSIVRPAATTATSDAIAASANDPKPPARIPQVTTFIVPALVGIVTLVCFAWTLLLLALNVAPNAVVNRIMDTEEFEHGTFWLLIDPSPSLLAMAAVALGPVAIV